MFSRVVDVHNCDAVLACLSPREVGALFCRLVSTDRLTD